jgi:hypothetical protein
MGLGWLGTFRQGQWQAYRSYVLHERRDVGRRMTVIDAELVRIGTVSVGYQTTTNENGEATVTEERTAFRVSQGSTLEKLFQAYIAQGGNPFDVSLFLNPDSTYWVDPEAETSEVMLQPYKGVIYPKSGSYGIGATYDGGFLQVKKYTPAKTGGRKELQDTTIASAVDLSRRWINQTVQERLHDLEARIIKICDLKEQLLLEQDALTMAVGGTVGAVPTLDQEFYDEKMGVAKIVAAIDSIFYLKDSNGAPDFLTENTEVMSKFPWLLRDDPGGEEDNTAL